MVVRHGDHLNQAVSVQHPACCHCCLQQAWNGWVSRWKGVCGGYHLVSQQYKPLYVLLPSGILYIWYFQPHTP